MRQTHISEAGPIRATLDGTVHDIGLPIAFEHPGFAPGTFEGVKINRLEHRLYIALEARCTKIMLWFTARLGRFERIHKSTHIGFGQRVAFRLFLKSVPLFQLVLKFQNLVLHRHLRLLGLKQLVDGISGEEFDLGHVGVRFPDQIENAFDCGGRSRDQSRRTSSKFEGFLDE